MDFIFDFTIGTDALLFQTDGHTLSLGEFDQFFDLVETDRDGDLSADTAIVLAGTGQEIVLLGVSGQSIASLYAQIDWV